jgi:hypothetical protein
MNLTPCWPKRKGGRSTVPHTLIAGRYSRPRSCDNGVVLLQIGRHAAAVPHYRAGRDHQAPLCHSHPGRAAGTQARPGGRRDLGSEQWTPARGSPKVPVSSFTNQVQADRTTHNHNHHNHQRHQNPTPFQPRAAGIQAMPKGLGVGEADTLRRPPKLPVSPFTG